MGINKELLETIKGLEWETITDFVSTEVKEVYTDAHINPGFEGWKHKIILDKDGRLYVSGAMGTGTTTESLYKGDSVCLGEINANYYNEYIPEFEEYNLNAEEQKQLLEKLLTQCTTTDLLDGAEEDETNALLQDLYRLNVADFENTFIMEFPSKYKEMYSNHVNACWDAYDQDNILDCISNRLEDIKEFEG